MTEVKLTDAMARARELVLQEAAQDGASPRADQLPSLDASFLPQALEEMGAEVRFMAGRGSKPIPAELLRQLQGKEQDGVIPVTVAGEELWAVGISMGPPSRDVTDLRAVGDPTIRNTGQVDSLFVVPRSQLRVDE
jgi:hypothetical protein